MNSKTLVCDEVVLGERVGGKRVGRMSARSAAVMESTSTQVQERCFSSTKKRENLTYTIETVLTKYQP